jgi:hypothetical protein
MDKATFESLPTEDVARLLREDGPKVCGFPINGTRRWFFLEHGTQTEDSHVDTYIEAVSDRYVNLLRMLFDHGIDIILAPVFGPDLLNRGEGYRALMEEALVGFARNQVFLDFYEDYDVRVRVYGDAERYLGETRYAHALDAYDELARRTASRETRRLFYGVCAHDPAETVAGIGVSFHEERNRLPTKSEIIEAYFGEHVPPVDLFIGFADRHAVFDMPLIATGSEDLYFTVRPSPYLDARTLRAILFDHLYARRSSPRYEDLKRDEWEHMREFYRVNKGNVQGVGLQHHGIWFPLPQVVLTEDLRSQP